MLCLSHKYTLTHSPIHTTTQTSALHRTSWHFDNLYSHVRLIVYDVPCVALLSGRGWSWKLEEQEQAERTYIMHEAQLVRLSPLTPKPIA